MERFRQKKSKLATNTQGNSQIQKQKGLPKLASDSSAYSGRTTEGDSFTCEMGRSSTRRVTGTPIKKLLDEEMSKETDSNRQPPGVIARLMGLDGLPPQQPLHGQHKGFSETYRRKCALISSQRDGKPYERQLSRKNSMEQQEFKDVYEVLETTKVERGSCPERGTLNSKLSEAEMAFIQQKFTDVKCLSTDEKLLYNSKEFCDTLEMLGTNKDLLMKFLQQPDSLFKKHLLDLQDAAPRTQCSHITVIKPSKSEKYESNTLGWKSEKETLQCDTSSHRIHHDGLSSRSYKQAQKPLKSSKIQLEGKHETDIPIRIVVLKPNLEKVQNATKSVSSSCSSHATLSDCGKRTGNQGVSTGEAGSRVKKNLSNDAGFLRPKSRESREIAKEITRRMRESFRGEPIDLSIFRGYAGDESSYDTSESDSGSESEVAMFSSRKSFHLSNRRQPSSSHSIESSVSMEAKKRLSERWKMSQRYHDAGAVGKSSTLGEMLSVPERGLRPENLDPMIGLDGSSYRYASSDEIAEWNSPLGISSRDGWKDGCIRNSSSSGSVPVQDSYLMPGETMNRVRNKATKGNFTKKEDSLSRNIRSGKKKTQSSCHTYGDTTDSMEEKPYNKSQMEINLGRKELSEQKYLVSEMLANFISSKSSIPDAETIAGHGNMTLSAESPDELPPKPSKEDSKAQVPQIRPSEEDSVPPQCSVPEPQSPPSSKEGDHPSPVSVLEVPFTEDVSSGSECFERVSAELHELRIQLKLLKMESGACAEGGMLVSSDKHDSQVAVSEEWGVFTDESLESSYLVDLLIVSGFDVADPDTFTSTWYSPECPVGPWVFDSLEKKYETETTWSRPERKLLFDRINSGLLEMSQRFTDPHPWVKLVTPKVNPKWQKHRVKYELQKLLENEEKKVNEDATEMVLDREMQWLDIGDDIDAVGKELEKLLIDSLIGELANV